MLVREPDRVLVLPGETQNINQNLQNQYCTLSRPVNPFQCFVLSAFASKNFCSIFRQTAKRWKNSLSPACMFAGKWSQRKVRDVLVQVCCFVEFFHKISRVDDCVCHTWAQICKSLLWSTIFFQTHFCRFHPTQKSLLMDLTKIAQGPRNNWQILAALWTSCPEQIKSDPNLNVISASCSHVSKHNLWTCELFRCCLVSVDTIRTLVSTNDCSCPWCLQAFTHKAASAT